MNNFLSHLYRFYISFIAAPGRSPVVRVTHGGSRRNDELIDLEVSTYTYAPASNNNNKKKKKKKKKKATLKPGVGAKVSANIGMIFLDNRATAKLIDDRPDGLIHQDGRVDVVIQGQYKQNKVSDGPKLIEYLCVKLFQFQGENDPVYRIKKYQAKIIEEGPDIFGDDEAVVWEEREQLPTEKTPSDTNLIFWGSKELFKDPIIRATMKFFKLRGDWLVKRQNELLKRYPDIKLDQELIDEGGLDLDTDESKDLMRRLEISICNNVRKNSNANSWGDEKFIALVDEIANEMETRGFEPSQSGFAHVDVGNFIMELIERHDNGLVIIPPRNIENNNHGNNGASCSNDPLAADDDSEDEQGEGNSFTFEDDVTLAPSDEDNSNINTGIVSLRKEDKRSSLVQDVANFVDPDDSNKKKDNNNNTNGGNVLSRLFDVLSPLKRNSTIADIGFTRSRNVTNSLSPTFGTTAAASTRSHSPGRHDGRPRNGTHGEGTGRCTMHDVNDDDYEQDTRSSDFDNDQDDPTSGTNTWYDEVRDEFTTMKGNGEFRVVDLGTYQGRKKTDIANSHSSCSAITVVLMSDHLTSDIDGLNLDNNDIADVIDERFVPTFAALDNTALVDPIDAMCVVGLYEHPYEHTNIGCYMYEVNKIEEVVDIINGTNGLVSCAMIYRHHIVSILKFEKTLPRFVLIESLGQRLNDTINEYSINGFRLSCDTKEGLIKIIMYYLLYNRISGYDERQRDDERKKIDLNKKFDHKRAEQLSGDPDLELNGNPDLVQFNIVSLKKKAVVRDGGTPPLIIENNNNREKWSSRESRSGNGTASPISDLVIIPPCNVKDNTVEASRGSSDRTHSCYVSTDDNDDDNIFRLRTEGSSTENNTNTDGNLVRLRTEGSDAENNNNTGGSNNEYKNDGIVGELSTPRPKSRVSEIRDGRATDTATSGTPLPSSTSSCPASDFIRRSHSPGIGM
jgi:hypothetical protein